MIWLIQDYVVGTRIRFGFRVDSFEIIVVTLYVPDKGVKWRRPKFTGLHR